MTDRPSVNQNVYIEEASDKCRIKVVHSAGQPIRKPRQSTTSPAGVVARARTLTLVSLRGYYEAPHKEHRKEVPKENLKESYKEIREAS